MSEQAARKRTRGGGGAARRAERTAVVIETAKYIERNIPNFEILNEEALEIIETNAETVLAEIGVNFVNNPAALERWRNAGADVDGERRARRHVQPEELLRVEVRDDARHVCEHEVGGARLVLVVHPLAARDRGAAAAAALWESDAQRGARARVVQD